MKEHKLQFKAVKIKGVWYEPITEATTKEKLKSHIAQLQKYHAEYVLFKNEVGYQLMITKEEYDRIDKKYKYVTKEMPLPGSGPRHCIKCRKSFRSKGYKDRLCKECFLKLQKNN